MKSDETDDNSTERGQRSHANENSHQRGVAGLTLELVFRPTDLPIDVGMDRAAQRSEHQPRPRDIIPMTTPTSSAPAIVPRGLRRAIPASSEASVLACSLAGEASSEPASVTPLVVLPTCEATVWLMLRAVASQVGSTTSGVTDAGSELASPAKEHAKTLASELAGMARRNPLGTIAGALLVGVVIGMMSRGRG